MTTLSKRIEEMLALDGVTPFLPGEPLEVNTAGKWDHLFCICPLCRTKQFGKRWGEHAAQEHWPCPNGCGAANPKIGVHMRNCRRKDLLYLLEGEIARLDGEILDAQRASSTAKEILASFLALRSSLDDLGKETKMKLLELLEEGHPGISSWIESLPERARSVRELTSQIAG